MTYLVYSLRGIGSTFVPGINVVLDLAKPKLVPGILVTDGAGGAERVLRVPVGARGLDVWFQVVQVNLKTGVVDTRIE